MSATKIMVVEDERIIALHMKQQLARMGYDVVGTAASGMMALDKISHLHPDLVLMDIHIDGEVDGIETAARIPSTLHIPVIYLTAFAEESTLERARATHPYGYLLKPFSERELHASIMMALERSHLDIAQQRNRERLSAALDVARMGVWELNPETKTFLFGDLAGKMFGNGHRLVTSTWDRLLGQVHEEDRPLLEEMLEQLAVEGTAGQIDFRRPTRRGTRWLRMQCRQVSGDPGDAKRIVGVVHDVTDSREKDERLRKTAGDLAEERERLSEALDVAEKANHAKSNFLAVMSHELRTPMNAILGFGQLLEGMVFGELNERQLEYVGHILSAGDHLLRLINDILDLAKIEETRLQVEIERVELAPVMGRVAASLAQLAADNGIQLSTEMRGELAVAADVTRLSQVLINLVSNAIKYSQPGGVVRMYDEVRKKNWVRITVADNGVGIPPQLQSHVFEPFNRLGAEHGTVPGTGIGLHITKRLVALMGGEIGFESEPGTGTKFWIDLPIHNADSGSASEQDLLTGLPSRMLLNDRIRQAIALAQRNMKKVGVLSLGLHNFDRINDGLGRPVGTRLLQSVADRVVECVRKPDTVSRQSGEEFVVLLSEMKRVEDLATVANRILESVTKPYAVDHHHLRLDASIGVAFYPDDGMDAETLVDKSLTEMRRSREFALLRAKQMH
jgi:diguanylate cyclase (GGDEF)-like protein